MTAEGLLLEQVGWLADAIEASVVDELLGDADGERERIGPRRRAF